MVRDRERGTLSGSRETVQDQACMYLWQELVCTSIGTPLLGPTLNIPIANWKRRTQLIGYCTDVVDKSLEGHDNALSNTGGDPRAERRLKAMRYSDEVKVNITTFCVMWLIHSQRNHIRNELTVEAIVRQRSMEAFQSRCRYFTPPLNDEEARKMWYSAQR